ncbi:hypothetical protein C9J12_28100 [Photobacterium frigidiphilum]|uniref:HTH deoR-type domain-containing protein n=1 Tax=Photobacterium frigidiphilum TaxID=264736 RepID=A0A2T3J6G0_9GAMM|nr:DeoR/GlpR family DNA-binding transcription regulator [Photobacterium frigidiphilum]PSU43445.1 hypothetical protein C9J12_28100 [Photobacterium frigidiphilum]
MPSHNLDLNNPDTRQRLLVERLLQNTTLVAKDIAQELAVSIDTIRRDFIALEAEGLLKRVKGGAVPTTSPVPPMVKRVKETANWLRKDNYIMGLLNNSETIFFDGGTSALGLAQMLPRQFTGLIITPSPLIAAIAMEKEIETYLIGGKIAPSGGISTGAVTVDALRNCHADLCILGSCGLDTEFGLSALNLDESAVKKAMAHNSERIVVLASEDKLNMRSRHRVIETEKIAILITNASSEKTIKFQHTDLHIHHV